MCMAGMLSTSNYSIVPRSTRGGAGKSGVGSLGHRERAAAVSTNEKGERRFKETIERATERHYCRGSRKGEFHSARVGNLRDIRGRGSTAQLSLKRDSASRWHGFQGRTADEWLAC